MTKFIVGDQYIYQADSELFTYSGESKHDNAGVFKSDSGNVYHYHYVNMTPYKQPKPKYPNPPLPHCEERIAFAKGADIEVSINNRWEFTNDPKWHKNIKYRVKVEKTEDDLRIEELERRIAEDLRILNMHKKELAQLKPTVHY
tara:strand:- start:159 stop:590 length:432 start_codon:yes stop_codon:yes gene_type:complete